MNLGAPAPFCASSNHPCSGSTKSRSGYSGSAIGSAPDSSRTRNGCPSVQVAPPSSVVQGVSVYVRSSSLYESAGAARSRAESALTNARPVISSLPIGACTTVHCPTPDVVCRMLLPPDHAQPSSAPNMCRSSTERLDPLEPPMTPVRSSRPTLTGTATTTVATTATSAVTSGRRRGRTARSLNRVGREARSGTGRRVEGVERLPDVVVVHLLRSFRLRHQCSKPRCRSRGARFHCRDRDAEDCRRLLDAHVHQKTQRQHNAVIALQPLHGRPHIEPLVDSQRPVDRITRCHRRQWGRPCVCAKLLRHSCTTMVRNQERALPSSRSCGILRHALNAAFCTAS